MFGRKPKIKVYYNVTKISFFNTERATDMFNDATEFDTWYEPDLAELWWEFCKENKLIEIEKKMVEEEE